MLQIKNLLFIVVLKHIVDSSKGPKSQFFDSLEKIAKMQVGGEVLTVTEYSIEYESLTFWRFRLVAYDTYLHSKNLYLSSLMNGTTNEMKRQQDTMRQTIRDSLTI